MMKMYLIKKEIKYIALLIISLASLWFGVTNAAIFGELYLGSSTQAFILNHVGDSIPASWNNLTNLEYVDMSSNNLTGNLPENRSGLSHLYYIDLSNFTQNPLTRTVVGSNHISGPLPDSRSYLTGLQTLKLSYNRLSCGIPYSWTGLTNIIDGSFSKNYIYISSITNGDFKSFLDAKFTGWNDQNITSVDRCPVCSISADRQSARYNDTTTFSVGLLRNLSNVADYSLTFSSGASITGQTLPAASYTYIYPKVNLTVTGYLAKLEITFRNNSLITGSCLVPIQVNDFDFSDITQNKIYINTGTKVSDTQSGSLSAAKMLYDRLIFASNQTLVFSSAVLGVTNISDNAAVLLASGSALDLSGGVQISSGVKIMPAKEIYINSYDSNGLKLMVAGSNHYALLQPNTTIIGNSGWDSELLPPISNGRIISFGSNTTSLLFDKPVKLLMASMPVEGTNYPKYRSHTDSVWYNISNLCNTTYGNIPTNISLTGTTKECYQTDGTNTIIWTHHATDFTIDGPQIQTPQILPIGGGLPKLEKDNCPNGDNSPSYYDRKCGQISAHDAASTLQNYKIIHGFHNDLVNYRMNDSLNINQMAKIMVRTLTDQKYEDPYSGPSRGYLYRRDMKNLGIGDYTKISGTRKVTFGMMVEMIINGLDYLGELDSSVEIPQELIGSKKIITRGDAMRLVVRFLLPDLDLKKETTPIRK